MQSFNELELNPNIQRAIQELGFTTPSPIQAETLPILLGEPTDFIGLAATGTGKTAAFGLPMLQRLDPNQRGVQVLILCPTRELAIQVAGQISLMGKYMGVKALPIYGGAPYGDQIHGLKRGANVVVGTPGRVCDHMEKGTLVLDGLHTVILDEADEMISMGFKEDLETILNAAPEGACSKWLFSATMSREVRKVADDYLTAPKQVQINKTEVVPELIEQLYFMTREDDKPELICKLLEAADEHYGLIFCQTKALVVDLTQYLLSRGYKVDCLHGDMDQAARERTMKSFRDRRVTLLVCTDVASRGLDVKDITHVINYSLPRELDNYVHRIGRTARSGKTGFALNLVTASHRGLISRIEKMTKSRMKEGRIPSRKELAAKKLSRSLEKLQAVQGAESTVQLLSPEWIAYLESTPAAEIAARFLILNFPDLVSDPSYERANDRTADRPAGRTSERSRSRDQGGPRGYPRPRYQDARGSGPSDRYNDRPAPRPRAPVPTPIALSPKGPVTGPLSLESFGESFESEGREERYDSRPAVEPPARGPFKKPFKKPYAKAGDRPSFPAFGGPRSSAKPHAGKPFPKFGEKPFKKKFGSFDANRKTEGGFKSPKPKFGGKFAGPKARRPHPQG